MMRGDDYNAAAKMESELSFWATRYVEWGKVPFSGRGSLGAQNVKEYFDLEEDCFEDKIVIDIGCGPTGYLAHFEAKLKFGVDVLARHYAAFGVVDQDMVYICAPAEDLPFLDEFADVVLSVNALDHVGDFGLAVNEIHRVLKPGGQILLQFDAAHEPTLEEPLLITDALIEECLSRRFDYEIVKRWKRGRHGESVAIVGTKLGSHQSSFVQHALQHVELAEGLHGEKDRIYLQVDLARQYGAGRSVLAKLYIARAFRAYQKDDPRGVMHSALRAGLYDPRVLLNRGAVAIVGRALLRLGRRGTG